ncbi:hypothetical protein [Nocardioides sambongensis]|uniref:hypothetical protein n=1 Tax=Nocardioides sambongensis TaxID=2589074 RepID=UPI00112E8144|nr:hypothetical protein [Nocardioides sambongensis]
MLAVLCAVLTGCDADTGDDGHPREDGPLTLSGEGGGGVGDYAPPRRKWVGDTWALTVGGLALCVDDPDVTVTLQGATATGDPAPQGVTGVIRRMTPALREAAAPGESTAPLLGARGTPPQFAESYSGNPDPLAGEVQPLEDATVDQPCSTRTGSGYDYTELLLTAYADEKGGLATSFDITYTADDETYVLNVPWEIAMCGTEVDADVTPSC